MGGIWSAEDNPGESDSEEHETLSHVLCQDGNSPTTAEQLADQLFDKVYDLKPQYAERITGMLLECDRQRLILMLQNESVLEEMVERALDAIEDDDSTDESFSESDDSNETREQIGEALYEKVAELEPVLCGQITGMLLELGDNTVHELINSRESLENAIAKARAEYLLHASVTPSESSSSDDDDELGCELYKIVAEKYPENADKITGMLLELDQNVIEKLLDNPKDLNASIERAKTALYEDSIV